MAIDNLGPAANEAMDRGRRVMDKTMEKGREMMDEGYETVQQVAEKGRDALQGGVEAVQKFASETTMDDVREFVRNEPWAAVAIAFGVGYLVAQIFKRVA
ncbi:MAG: hypothetical protein Q7S58_16685 [Candidatus Binatus sp.]|uniref:hypothetical protein n=1 Tax=Candidatus Binatus sp. TaxID=2811406 RepID=UPI002728F000|nr:hypothetical protein [Candidatus Binatus sp.]MDO8434036.1 hypothetical protein [Candidatus Binatus sp.]